MAEHHWRCPNDWLEWATYLEAGLDARNRWQLVPVLAGVLLARGRRTVTTWWRAAGVADEFRHYYYFLQSAGHHVKGVSTQLLSLIVKHLPVGDKLILILDDTPTKRYGPKVEGADKAPFLKRARRLATVVGRLRRDAALNDLPQAARRGRSRGRGRPSKYGKHAISLAKRAGQRRGWTEVECVVYGKRETKSVKTFLATYRPAQGLVRVVILRGDHAWIPLFCTDPDASVVEIVQLFAARATIEQDFHDVKEVWGTGQQQVRNIWTNVAVFNLNLWSHSLVELWAWRRSAEEIRDRSDSPWDDPERRPSHADRRKALRRHVLREEFKRAVLDHPLPRQILRYAEKLIGLGA